MSERLAPGAPAPPDFVPLSEPRMTGREWLYVKECLDTNWVSSVGRFVDRFEQEIARRLGVAHAVATASGTAALHLALELVGVRPGDEVAVSTLTFIAPANAIRYCGAHPVFIDAEPAYWQMDPELLRRFLRDGCRSEGGVLRNRVSGRPVRAVLPVNLLGHPCDLDPIREIAAAYELPVIEDAAEGLGACYRSRPLGSLGTIGCLSFNGNKILTTGGGGMLVTDRTDLAERARYLSTQAKDDPLEYVHGAVGYNYRLTNLQAAVGCAQLEALDEYIGIKRRIAADYQALLAPFSGIAPMREAPWAQSTFWLYTVLVDEARAGLDSRALLRGLAAQRIQSRPLWQPLHQSPAHRGAQVVGGEVAERLHRQALSLPCSTSLTGQAWQRVAAALEVLLRSGAGARPAVGPDPAPAPAAVADGAASPGPGPAAGARVVRLRPAAPADRDQVLLWANDPDTRRASFCQERITAEEHQAWFAHSLSLSSRQMFIVELDGEDVGFARLEWDGASAEVGINIAPERRRSGLGLATLHALAGEAARRGCRLLVARIRLDNRASISVFEKAGYRFVGPCTMRGVAGLRYERELAPPGNGQS